MKTHAAAASILQERLPCKEQRLHRHWEMFQPEASECAPERFNASKAHRDLRKDDVIDAELELG
jgi:hypothetical protein